MDTQSNQTPTVPSAASPQPDVPQNGSQFSLRAVIIIAVIILLLGGAAAATYFTNRWTASPKGEMATSTPAAVDQGIAWQSVVGEKPTTTFAWTTDYYTDAYDVYLIGTYTKGQYAGSKLYLAEEKNTDVNYDSGHFMYIGDTSGKPIAWWGYFGTYGPGMGDLPVPPEVASTTELATSTFPVADDASTFNTSDSEEAGVILSADLIVPADPSMFSRLDSVTVDTQPVVRSPIKPTGVAFSDLQQYDYYSQTPFGALHSLTLLPNFLDMYSNTPPGLTWQVGSTSVATYNFGHYVYGVSDCFASFTSIASLEASFVRTGTTEKGDALYEVNPIGHDDVYRCLYPKTQRYDYNPDTQTSSSYYPTTYKEFLKTHPIFFWKHPYGEWMAFGRSDVVPAAEKAKPVIYLYPTTTEHVAVQVHPIGGFTKTDPVYGQGWEVRATPSGNLTNLHDGTSYPYLFWEGGGSGTVATPTQGFVVARGDIPALLEQKLTLIGLSEKERSDFKAFWVPRLSSAPYYFITFIPRSEIDRVAPLSVTPQPDTVIRVLMDYRPLTAPISVEPLQIAPTIRKGFTVVEWGGIVR